LEKERIIQSGQGHYSEMLTHEGLPSRRYMALFYKALKRNDQRMALDLLCLARGLAAAREGAITLVSLARAGTPIGVLLKHVLARYFGRDATHYSISIIRDRGIDQNALRYILERHDDKSLAFIDGWTAKGAIAAELQRSVADFNRIEGSAVSPGLHVLSDLAGEAEAAAGCEDYLIPSSILNATISGLISRSILISGQIGPSDFHGCLFYGQFRAADRSRWFVSKMLKTVEALPKAALAQETGPVDRAGLKAVRNRFLADIRTRFGVRDHNRIKPGIGEATRVLLRRVPHLLIVRDLEDRAVHHLRLLAAEKHVPVITDSRLPYRAVSLIQEISHHV
ncbi:MAG: cysteine protease StiP family protein, partial [Methylococcaceae bacterium]|nr:cysteine protease StiP family protein [Methylococcaceae bacterium]